MLSSSAVLVVVAGEKKIFDNLFSLHRMIHIAVDVGKVSKQYPSSVRLRFVEIFQLSREEGRGPDDFVSGSLSGHIDMVTRAGPFEWPTKARLGSISSNYK